MELGHQGSKIRQAIGGRLQNDDSDAELGKVLLKGEVSVDRHENIELCLSESEWLTVLDTGPAGLRHRASGSLIPTCGALGGEIAKGQPGQAK